MTETVATNSEICENKQALLDEIIITHRNRPGAMMVILNEIQKRVGYVSEPMQHFVARKLRVPVSAVHGVDMQMPNMNGIEATQAIRALPGRGHVPIVAMTANAFDEDRQHCLDAGMNDHVGKPVDQDSLYETLIKWLEKPRG